MEKRWPKVKKKLICVYFSHWWCGLPFFAFGSFIHFVHCIICKVMKDWQSNSKSVSVVNALSFGLTEVVFVCFFVSEKEKYAFIFFWFSFQILGDWDCKLCVSVCVLLFHKFVQSSNSICLTQTLLSLFVLSVFRSVCQP